MILPAECNNGELKIKIKARGYKDLNFTITEQNEITGISADTTKPVEKPLDKKALEEKIAEAKAIKQGNKTDEAFKTLKTAIGEAEASLNTAKTKEEIQAAVDKLTQAIKDFEVSKDKIEEYIISFNSNGGQGSMAEVNKHKSENYELPACGFTAPEGQEFDVWEILGQRYEVGSRVEVNSNIEVKALWKNKQNVNPKPQPAPTPSPEPKPTPKPEQKPNEDKPNIENHHSSSRSYWSAFPSTSLDISKKEDKKIENINLGYKDYKNHWSEKAVDFCMRKDYFKDIAEKSNFNPEKAATRGEFVTVLARFAGINAKDYNNKFTDVDNSKYYAGYIAWANENKIVLGIGNNKFEAERSITRAEMATIMFRFSKVVKLNIKEEKPIKTFKDEKDIPSWAKEAVNEMVKRGILEGNKDNSFNPSGNFKRAELAQVIYNLSK